MFQVLWLLGRILIHHYTRSPTQAIAHRSLYKRSWASLSGAFKKRVVNVMVALSKYIISVHRWQEHVYLGRWRQPGCCLPNTTDSVEVFNAEMYALRRMCRCIFPLLNSPPTRQWTSTSGRMQWWGRSLDTHAITNGRKAPKAGWGFEGGSQAESEALHHWSDLAW